LPARIPAISDQFIEQREPERVAALFLPRFDTAECDPGAATRLRPCETGSNEVVRVAVDVEAQLLVHLLLNTRALKGTAQPRSQSGKGFHASSGGASRIPAMMLAIRFQSRVSCWSWRRPAAVNR
jgi:hypothetical protein